MKVIKNQTRGSLSLGDEAKNVTMGDIIFFLLFYKEYSAFPILKVVPLSSTYCIKTGWQQVVLSHEQTKTLNHIESGTDLWEALQNPNRLSS